ncbi:hypothetical protein Tsubulata_001961 [Turnera subulata]|uniref:Uncharacterized protein n=1 Tax=Turnera subulata TaxID=218843 RepID=A0A9Q0J3Y8_9ROSI|nr:hypothetical protein Tsubulata_001961 [Turnera subulata]
MSPSSGPRHGWPNTKPSLLTRFQNGHSPSGSVDATQATARRRERLTGENGANRGGGDAVGC